MCRMVMIVNYFRIHYLNYTCTEISLPPSPVSHVLHDFCYNSILSKLICFTIVSTKLHWFSYTAVHERAHRFMCTLMNTHAHAHARTHTKHKNKNKLNEWKNSIKIKIKVFPQNCVAIYYIWNWNSVKKWVVQLTPVRALTRARHSNDIEF